MSDRSWSTVIQTSNLGRAAGDTGAGADGVHAATATIANVMKDRRFIQGSP
jgi:hypothetical protein